MEGPSRRTAPDRDLLLANHVFPGEYVVKAFGPGTDSFKTAVHRCATAVVGRVDYGERTSSGGRRVCVTLTLHAETVDDVIDVYERLHGVPELMLIL